MESNPVSRTLARILRPWTSSFFSMEDFPWVDGMMVVEDDDDDREGDDVGDSERPPSKSSKVGISSAEAWAKFKSA